MSKILVMGGTRFFGKHLVYRLLELGHDITLATRGLRKDSFQGNVERLTIDRTDKATLIKAFQHKMWDVVYDQSCYTPQEAFDAGQALKGKAQRYILTSSQAVYEFGTNRKEDEFNPYTFSFSYKPKQQYLGYNGYQEGKRAAESVLFNDTAFEVAAVRFPIVVGKEDHTKRLEFHVKRILNNESIGISKPNARYSFISSNEAGEFLARIGLSSFTGAINPGCKNDLSLIELINKIESRTGKQAKITNLITPSNQSTFEIEGSCSVNTDKAAGLGYNFSDINDVFDSLIDYYSNKTKGHN